jgi:molybdopterin-guanine dinucleotide biosynthesis protein A
MSIAGYVLAGGQSTRMGTDKALLPVSGRMLVEQVAGLVRTAAGNVTLIGDPEKYSWLELRVIPDARVGMGPLAGMEAALLDTSCEWNLIAACDMASLRADFLRELCRMALALPDAVDCLVPASGPEQRWQPLSALYRRRCLNQITAALDRGIRKVTDVAASLNVHIWHFPDAVVFQNINTPEDWNRYLNGRTESH